MGVNPTSQFPIQWQSPLLNNHPRIFVSQLFGGSAPAGSGASFLKPNIAALQARVATTHASHWATVDAWCNGVLTQNPLTYFATKDAEYTGALAFSWMLDNSKVAHGQKAREIAVAIANDAAGAGSNRRDRTLACAFVYDWLWSLLSGSERTTIRNYISNQVAALRVVAASEGLWGVDHGDVSYATVALIAILQDGTQVQNDTWNGWMDDMMNHRDPGPVNPQTGFFPVFRHFGGMNAPGDPSDGGTHKGSGPQAYDVSQEEFYGRVFPAVHTGLNMNLWPLESWFPALAHWKLWHWRGDRTFHHQAEVRVTLPYSVFTQSHLHQAAAVMAPTAIVDAENIQWLADEHVQSGNGIWGPWNIHRILWDDKSIPLSFTGLAWTRSGSTITITHPAHGLLAGETIQVSGTSSASALSTGSKKISNVTTNTFTVNGQAAGDASGTCSIRKKPTIARTGGNPMRFFERAGKICIRENWDTQGLSFTDGAQTKFTDGHSDRDDGHFELCVEGVPMCITPGHYDAGQDETYKLTGSSTVTGHRYVYRRGGPSKSGVRIMDLSEPSKAQVDSFQLRTSTETIFGTRASPSSTIQVSNNGWQQFPKSASGDFEANNLGALLAEPKWNFTPFPITPAVVPQNGNTGGQAYAVMDITRRYFSGKMRPSPTTQGFLRSHLVYVPPGRIPNWPRGVILLVWDCLTHIDPTLREKTQVLQLQTSVPHQGNTPPSNLIYTRNIDSVRAARLFVKVLNLKSQILTWARSGSTVTVTMTAHGLANGETIEIADSSDTSALPNGLKTIANATANSFTVVGAAAGATSGTCTMGGVLDTIVGYRDVDNVLYPGTNIGSLDDSGTNPNGDSTPGAYRTEVWAPVAANAQTFVQAIFPCSSSVSVLPFTVALLSDAEWIGLTVGTGPDARQIKVRKSTAFESFFGPVGGDTTPPPAPTNLAGVAGNNRIDLDWDDSPASDFGTFKVYRSTLSGGVFSAFALLASPTASNYADLTALNGITYRYKVTAVDTPALNESADSNITPGLTPQAPGPPPDTTPPAAPTGLIATGGSGQVALDWNDNGEGDLSHYRLYREEKSGGIFLAEVLVASPAVSNHSDTTVTNGKTYRYRVGAADTSGNESARSAYSAEVTPQLPPPPAAPTGLVASTTSDAVPRVILNWNDNGEDDLGSYKVFREEKDAGGVFGSETLIASSLVVSALNDFGVQTGHVYRYRVSAVNTAGNEGSKSAYSNEVTAGVPPPPPPDQTPPATPTGLAGTPGNHQVLLTWNANVEPDLFGYRVERQTKLGDGTFTPAQVIASPTANTYLDPTTLNGTTYRYRVSAVDTSSNVSAPTNFSAEFTPAAPPPDVTAPATPTGLVATPGDAKVTLNWNANGEGDLFEYRVYRQTKDGAVYLAEIRVASPVANTYLDNAVQNGATYRYRISAVDTSGNESAPTAYTADQTPTGAEPVTRIPWKTTRRHSKWRDQQQA